ncbi:DUF5681 domain-containing protein [Paraburkholderia diazotrophica]|uniref:DUF5681 domain-containing protein n=1 Tax=Paraburkholderia diazotrophica TaxID=667676 RepID=A0A1H6TXY4_9BURK|nr:hypothetical protein [Paraburkholderia diazotrophica]SEI80612.1 hypothetical protein SAMN05192539_1004169 [Paraburkholderia diazotrophica]
MKFAIGNEFSRDTKYRTGESGNERGRTKQMKNVVSEACKPLRRHAGVLVEHAMAKALAGDAVCLAALLNLMSTVEQAEAVKRLSVAPQD